MKKIFSSMSDKNNAKISYNDSLINEKSYYDIVEV